MADVITVTAGSAGQAGSTAAELITYMSARLLEVAELNTILDQFGGESPNNKYALNTWKSQEDNQRQADADVEALAGFFAGEGYIGIRKSNKKSKSPTLTVEVGNTERYWAEQFEKRYGGNVRVAYPKRRNALPYHKWYIKDEKAATFLEDILPFLRGEKVQQAQIALRLNAIKSKKPNRGRAGVLGHFNAQEIADMEVLELELKNLRCAAAETKRAYGSHTRNDSPTPQAIGANS